MNIGIDIDDTIVNTYEMLLTLVSMKYGLNINDLLNNKTTYDMLENLEDFPRIKKDLFSVLAKSVTLKDGVVEVLNKLRNDGHKIIFISAREEDEYTNAYDVSYKYLIKNNIPFDKLIVHATEKGKICLDENIDLFIDDNDGHCQKVKNVGIKTLQFDKLFTDNVNDVKRVFSWNEVYEYIINL